MMIRLWRSIVFYITMFLAGGLVYGAIEVMYRGYTHWSMMLLGGLCFLVCDIIDMRLPSYRVVARVTICAALFTVLEYVTGLIVNVCLGWDIWDYSRLPLNLQGQICLLFSVVWFGIAFIAIWLDTQLRHILLEVSN